MSEENYSVVYSPEAIDDLKAIYRYISVDLQEKETAKNLIDRIRSKIRGLNTFPGKYKKVEWEPWAGMEMRQMPVENYIIFYLTNHSEKKVLIVRVFYGGRDIPNRI